jgi:hypothetical protein
MRVKEPKNLKNCETAVATKQPHDLARVVARERPYKPKLQPFLDSGEMLEGQHHEGLGFDPIPNLLGTDFHSA